jgi:tetratricopeptide (TPR) repeat protein
MNAIQKPAVLAVFLFLWVLPARAQAPLAKPLADFDKLVSQLKTSSVVGEPIRIGSTTVIPFTGIKFALGGGEAMAGFAGGMGGKTVPLGILIVEGDDVRAELFPAGQEEQSSLLQQIMQAILDRKVVIMGNGLNISETSGTLPDLAPLISGMMGQTTVIGNAVNLGGLAKQPSAASSVTSASPDELKKLFDTDVDRAIADFEAAIARKPSAENYYYLGEAFKNKGLKDKAAAAYKKALELQPNYPEASKALAATK